MHALSHRQFGRPGEVLEWVELDDPRPKPGQTVVEVLARPVNPMDLLIVRGHYPLRPTLPAIVGAEGIGRVVEADSTAGADAPRLGEWVLLPIRHGSWCTHTAVATQSLLSLPADIDPVQASMLRVNPLTAHLMLEQSGLEAGQWFVHGPARGSVGQHLIQLARARGLHCVGIVRQVEHAPELEALGCDHVVEIGPKLGQRVRERVGDRAIKVAFDGIGGEISAQMAGCLAPGGQVVTYGAMSRQGPRVEVADCVFRGIQSRGFWLLDWRRRHGLEREHAELRKLAALGLQCKIGARFGLPDYRDALALASSGQAGGRVMFTEL